jgi:hypothetical protein
VNLGRRCDGAASAATKSRQQILSEKKGVMLAFQQVVLPTSPRREGVIGEPH